MPCDPGNCGPAVGHKKSEKIIIFKSWTGKEIQALIDKGETKYRFTEDMDELSGDGPETEKVIQQAITLGLAWLYENPSINPFIDDNLIFLGATNEDCDQLSNVISTITSGLSGAWHRLILRDIAYIHKIGWQQFVAEMKARKNCRSL